MPDCTEYKHLMMGLMDNELTPEETADINRHLIRCESCRKEFDALSRSLSYLGAVSFSGPADDELDRIWKSPFSRFTRNAGIFLVIAGWVVLLLYTLFELLRSDTEPVLPRIATFGIIIGFIILLYTVLSDRIRALKTDPYKEVKR
jgi:anti-sigma factor RsiW